MLFLLVQLVVSTRPSEHVASLNPWTEYVKFLDDHVPVPTLWLDDDRLLLRGTSLEVGPAIKFVFYLVSSNSGADTILRLL